MTDRPSPDDSFDDKYGDDPFGVSPGHTDDPFADVRPAAPQAESDDPFDLEPVLDGEEYQNTPNSYNVRNIVLIASGGFVLVLVVFLFSMGGSGDEDGRLQVQAGAGLPMEATPPDLSLRPEQVEVGMGDDDLSMLLEDPALAQGGYGSYSSPPPPPQTRSSGGGGAASSGDRPPTYRELRREAFLAALGRQRAAVAGTAPQAPEGMMDGGYIVDAAGNVLPLAPGYTSPGASGGGVVQPASQWSGGVAAASGSSGAMRQAGTRAEPRFSPFTLAQGTLVNVVLETAVQSDTPGLVVFRTTEDVYDRHRRYVLVPRGSQIIALTGDVVDDRLLVDANRLNLPDGRSVDFSRAALHDAQGRLGLADEVDRHTLSRVGAGVLQTATGVASTVAGRRVGRSTVVIRNADGSISEVPIADDIEDEITNRGTRGAQRAVMSATQQALTRSNTVRLRQGLRAVVVFRDDVDLGGPYYQAGQVPAGRSPYDVRPQPGARSTPVFRNPQIPAPPPVRTPIRTAGARR